MSLHVESHGSGVPLLLIHGWGMHGGVWDGLVPRLAERFQVMVVDLPGHGRSRGSGDGAGETGVDAIVDRLSASFSEPLAVAGWSLGGMVAQRWAVRQPRQVSKLVLLASTPSFAERTDWAHGMPTATLLQFAAELEQNHAATLRRFIALQVRGSEGERELLTNLRASLFARGEPQMDALRGGLGILRDADLRATLPAIAQPSLVIAGERDKLTPPGASRYMAQALPQARLVEIAGAAHAPFLSHPEQVLHSMMEFLHE